VSVLVDGLCRENRVQDAVKFILELSGKNYNDLGSFCSNSTTDEGHSITNSVTYMTLICLYLDGQYCEADKIFTCMRESAMVPDNFTYS
jgi:pentatricopeptide repeat protein